MIAELRGIRAIWWRDVLRFGQDRHRIIASLAQPLLYLFVLGSGLGAAMRGVGPGAADFDYQAFLYPGVLAMTVLFTAMFSAISVVWDREFGFLKEVMVAPISRATVTIGKAIGGSTVAVLQGALILVFAPFVGIPITVLGVLLVIPIMFLTAFSLSALGLIVAARVQSMEGFPIVMNFLVMPMFFLSGALFPLIGLPLWLQFATRLNPVTYGVTPIRQVLLGDSAASVSGLAVGGFDLALPVQLLILAAFGFLMLGLAIRAFSRTE